MTVAATLAAGTGRLELILAIEGIGWLTDESDLSGGFDGDVFVTADQDGDLATQLGCTIHRGLRITGQIGETLDPRKGNYTLSALSGSITDYDGFLTANFNPHTESGTTVQLTQALGYNDVDPRVNNGVPFATGDLVWVGESEAIKLGTKTLVSGTEYEYLGSTRGYLGTPRGRYAGLPSGSTGFEWPLDTDVRDFARYRWRRNVELYAHVPGEAAVVRLWTGQHAQMVADAGGNVWSFNGPGEVLRAFSRKRVARDAIAWSSSAVWGGGEEFRNVDIPAYTNGGISIETPPSGNPNIGNRRLLSFRTRGLTQRSDTPYALPIGYQYRTEPGGTYGMRSAWDSGSVQARDTTNDTDVLGEFVRLGSKNYLALKRNVFPDDTMGNVADILTENLSRTGGNDGTYQTQSVEQVELFDGAVAARFLLSNWLDDAELNRFTVNNIVRRNPVDVLLCFLTTRDDEYYIADATGGTTTVPTFAAGVGATDLWAGAALHCVEGANKGEARVITANTNTSITVADAFSNTPASSTEYQVRNSIYDVLPFGWGMGITADRIDIDSFEALRDRNLPDAQVGRFYIGTQDSINIWEFLRTNILIPYGIHVYRDRTTGKLKAEYLGEAVGDGLIQSYTAIGEDDLLEPPGDIDYGLGAPARAVQFNMRTTEWAVVGLTSRLQNISVLVWEPPTVAEIIRERIPGDVNGETTPITVELESVGLPRYDGDLETIEFDAALNTTDNPDAALITRAHHILRSYSVPPPTTTLRLTQQHALTMRVNTFLLLTYADAPLNPFTLSNGWSNVVARVIQSGLMLEAGKPIGVEVRVELLSALTAGKVAPAAKLDGAKSGSDGTSDYFVVAPTEFVSDAANNKDYYGFVVGDRIELRDPDGASAGGPYTIRSFGANDVSDPTAASTDIIRINETVPAAGGLTTDDYLTFSSYSGSNTSNMDDHAAYSLNTSYTGGDAAKEYV